MARKILQVIGISLFAIMFAFGGVVAEEVEDMEYEVDFEQEVIDEEEVDFEEPDEMYPTPEETDFEMPEQEDIEATPEEDPMEIDLEEEVDFEDEDDTATWVIVAILVVVALGGIIYLVTGRK